MTITKKQVERKIEFWTSYTQKTITENINWGKAFLQNVEISKYQYIGQIQILKGLNLLSEEQADKLIYDMKMYIIDKQKAQDEIS